MTPLVDIGVNLVDRAFRADRAEVVARARAAGVTRMIVTGTTVDGSANALELARAHPGVLWSTAGVHPHHANSGDARTIDRLEALAAAPEVVAIGEAGLDFYRDRSPRPTQEQWLDAQLDLAVRLDRPVFLHCRDAHRRFREILDGHPGLRGVVHCFTGSLAEARDLLDRGLYLGITGWLCDERRGQHLVDVVRSVPLDRLLIETDAPYLLPRTLAPRPKSRRNEPMHLPHVLAALAEAIGQPPEALSAATTDNARHLFAL